VPGKLRVHELAKQLGVTSKELLATLKEQGEFVKTASSTIEPPVVKKMRAHYEAKEDQGGEKKESPPHPAQVRRSLPRRSRQTTSLLSPRRSQVRPRSRELMLRNLAVLRSRVQLPRSQAEPRSREQTHPSRVALRSRVLSRRARLRVANALRRVPCRSRAVLAA